MKKSKGTVVYFKPEFKITEKQNKEDLDRVSLIAELADE